MHWRRIYGFVDSSLGGFDGMFVKLGPKMGKFTTKASGTTTLVIYQGGKMIGMLM